LLKNDDMARGDKDDAPIASARGVAVLSRDDVPPEVFVSFLPGERKIALASTRKRDEQPTRVVEI